MPEQDRLAKSVRLDLRSIDLRRKIVDMLRHSRRGHVGASLSLVEIIRVLYDDVLRHDPANPHWPERDRFILSKGHGCMALYVVLAEKGYFPQDELARFCRFDGILGGHPDGRKIPGIEASTGSLGHGLSIGIGMAIHARLQQSSARVFVVVGDGECNEGSVWEAAMTAGKHGLDRLTVLVDYNKMQSYGPVADVQDLEPFADKWRAFGFSVEDVNGHDVAALRALLGRLPFECGRPNAVICHTIKGKGIAFAEQNPEWHHKRGFSDEEIARLEQALDEALCEKPA